MNILKIFFAGISIFLEKFPPGIYPPVSDQDFIVRNVILTDKAR